MCTFSMLGLQVDLLGSEACLSHHSLAIYIKECIDVNTSLLTTRWRRGCSMLHSEISTFSSWPRPEVLLEAIKKDQADMRTG